MFCTYNKFCLEVDLDKINIDIFCLFSDGNGWRLSSHVPKSTCMPTWLLASVSGTLHQGSKCKSFFHGLFLQFNSWLRITLCCVHQFICTNQLMKDDILKRGMFRNYSLLHVYFNYNEPYIWNLINCCSVLLCSLFIKCSHY